GGIEMTEYPPASPGIWTRSTRWAIALGVALCVALRLAASTNVEAHGTVDQQAELSESFHVCPSPGGTPGWAGQTFTPTQNNLVGFDLIFWGSGTFSYKILNWTTGAELATGGPVSVPHNEWVHFDLASPIHLSPGFKYAIVCTGGSVPNFRCQDNNYAGGAIINRGSNGSLSEFTFDELPFVTYYDPTLPPPTCGSGGDPVSNTCTYSFTGLQDTFTVPAGVGSLHVVAVGGAGGKGFPALSSGAPGGAGAKVTADVAVTPGAVLYVAVAGNGGSVECSGCIPPGGFNGGGPGMYSGDGWYGGAAGGGASDI